MPHPEESTPAAALPTTLEAWRSRPVLLSYKDDRRSHVWLTDADQASATGDRWVVKVYRGPAWRQTLQWRLNQHPAQWERRWVDRLADMDLPVVHVAAGGFDVGQAWLVTPYRGETLHKWIRRGQLGRDAPTRHAVTRQLGQIVGRLTHAKVLHRDAKASNFVIDDKGRVRLIDVGGCRGAKGVPLLGIALRMLATLHESVQIAAGKADDPAALPTRSDRMRCFAALRDVWDRFPDGLQHLPRNPEFRSTVDR